ncbi:acyl-CoA dehydrogenase [Nocardia miyunensis]|uniref:acyl-CoA dehydrogenase n=1 Tax=Nocardia miyunensis TaxID=282684 RepID=UPI00082CFE3C|nr:acyl-CoA dehydrogenase [Nocardia miyunensis]
MSLSITAEHRELAASVRDVLTARDAAGAARAGLDDDTVAQPPFWKDVVELGWLGMAVGEEFGGQGFGLPELAVVLEELGRVVAPGAFLPTALAIAVIDSAASDRAALLPSLCDGTVSAAVGLHGELHRDDEGNLHGDGGPVLGGAGAGLLLLAVGEDMVVVRPGPDVQCRRTEGLDLARRSVRVGCTAARPVATLPGARNAALALGRVLAAAEAVGGARACTEHAVTYARQRVQFGRTIGSFQAVKHLCAQMLADTELATAAAWDAARAAAEGGPQAGFAAAVAADIALDAYVHVAERNIQVHGGIGFTWEHNAHLYLRRAHALRATFGNAAHDVAELAIAGVERSPALDLPPEAQTYRDQAREFLARYRETPKAERRSLLVHSGYGFPHWPEPFGRAAGPVEQLVIEQELRDVPKVRLGIGDWILLTLVRHGNSEQIERWLWPSLEGRHAWCQLFSEPGAGSDAASITTRATRTDGGWRITGQKVWTSVAHLCDRGLATVRTDPDAPKHLGITVLVIDMHAPGVTVRPLREMTGGTTFNEVFLDDVFVPDQDVVGAVNDGWTVARATLGNERVGIGGSSHEYAPLDRAIAAPPADPGLRREIGHLVAERQAIRLLAFRNAARAVAGGDPGPEGNIAKLLFGENQQRVSDLLMRLGGADAGLDGDPELYSSVLFVRALTIAGGTSEVVRNQIAERILGLPREPTFN